jgi:hypothetical protein
MTGRIIAWTLARLLLPALLLGASGCDDPGVCPPDESFIVEERGTCSAARTRFTLANQGCRVFVEDGNPVSGLPPRGAMSQQPQPLRQGGFILYTEDPTPFRECGARRVAFHLDLTCFDAQGAPACTATLTEPTTP